MRKALLSVRFNRYPAQAGFSAARRAFPLDLSSGFSPVALRPPVSRDLPFSLLIIFSYYLIILTIIN